MMYCKRHFYFSSLFIHLLFLFIFKQFLLTITEKTSLTLSYLHKDYSQSIKQSNFI